MARGNSRALSEGGKTVGQTWDDMRDKYQGMAEDLNAKLKAAGVEASYDSWTEHPLSSWTGAKKPTSEWTAQESKEFNGYYKYTQNYTAKDIKVAREYHDKRFGITPQADLTPEQKEKQRNEVAGLATSFVKSAPTYVDALATRMYEDRQKGPKKDRISMEDATKAAKAQIEGFASKLIVKIEESVGQGKEIQGTPTITSTTGNPWDDSIVSVNVGGKEMKFQTKMIWNRVGRGKNKGDNYNQWPTRKLKD